MVQVNVHLQLFVRNFLLVFGWLQVGIWGLLPTILESVRSLNDGNHRDTFNHRTVIRLVIDTVKIILLISVGQ